MQKGNTMDTWFTQGFDEAEKMAQSAGASRKRSRNFWLKANEEAVIRFLKPAAESFNYKRAFVPWAKGQKLFTSPGSSPDPLLEAGLQLQAAFAWPILDRRILEFEDRETGETKKVGPRFLFFADGQMTRKALIALENTARKDINEERVEEGLEPFTEKEYNITHFDIRISKAEKGWNLSPIRGGKPKALSTEDTEIIEKYTFDLIEELQPLPVDQLRAVVAKTGSEAPAAEPETAYSYGDDSKDEPEFFSA
jgi:hypothetical protein